MTLSIFSQAKFDVRPAAVFLDLDNTVYPYDPCHNAALAQVRDKASRLLTMVPGDFDALYERARQDVKARVGRTAASHNRLLYFQRLMELAGLKTQVLIALDLEQTYWRSFLTHARLFADVLEFLEDVRLLEAPLVIITDLTAQIQFRKLIHFGLDRHVDYVVTSEEAGADKPAPVPFEVALEKIGPVTGPIWLIGDDPIADIGGAKALRNLVVIQKLHAGVKRSNPPADATFDSFSDLRNILERLGKTARVGRAK